VLKSITDERRQNLNDKVLVHAAMARAFMASHTAPEAMAELFSSHDSLCDYRVSLGLKLGLLLSGNTTMPDLEKAQ